VDNAAVVVVAGGGGVEVVVTEVDVGTDVGVAEFNLADVAVEADSPLAHAANIRPSRGNKIRCRLTGGS
jgi:hypothetical protein